MNRKLALLVLSILFLPATAMAYKGSIPPPRLVPDQYVYTIPPGYTPEGLSAMQQQQLNGELRRLHFPFYVVILQDLPRLGDAQYSYARSNGFTGDDNKLRIEVGTAMLMEDWAALEPSRSGRGSNHSATHHRRHVAHLVVPSSGPSPWTFFQRTTRSLAGPLASSTTSRTVPLPLWNL